MKMQDAVVNKIVGTVKNNQQKILLFLYEDEDYSCQIIEREIRISGEIQ